MPFCPRCQTEYCEGVQNCADCDEILVASLPEKSITDDESPEARYDHWIALVSLVSHHYANLVVEILHQKNIPAVIYSAGGHFGHLDQMGPSSFRPVGGACLIMVPEEFVLKADREGETILGDTWVNSRLFNIVEYE